MKSMNKDWDEGEKCLTLSAFEWDKKSSMSVCKSYADYTGKQSSDNDIQLMVYSVRN